MLNRIHKKWTHFWMQHARLTTFGRISTSLAKLLLPTYKARTFLVRLNKQWYISPDASIHHNDLHLGNNIFIGERVVIYQNKNGGPVNIGKGTHIHRDTIIESGHGGALLIGDDSHIQPRCQFSSYKGSITVGSGVQIGPNCAFYPYDHSFSSDGLIKDQPLQTKGGIVIDDDAWIGFGVIVLDGVRIGKGAVVGAGSVVKHDVADGAIAAGVPARVLKMRSDVRNSSASSNI